ncbi:MAG: NAD+ synthase [Phycisphaerales bacterium]|nr:NAD+ synthase [Phycisphaerales bacterium]
MLLALAQINPTVGDLRANAARIAEFTQRAREAGARLAIFPELALCGYPPKDLLLHESFIRACAAEAKALGEGHSAGLTLIFGTPLPAEGGVANGLLAYRDGVCIGTYHKRLLPTYDVFDEDRYFVRGARPCVIQVDGLPVGLSICEDLWKAEDAGFNHRYRELPDPVVDLARAGARLVVNPSASPFVLGKGARHRALLARHASTHGVFVAAVNQVGGNDELIFDGFASMHDPSGRLVAAGPGFEEALTLAEVSGTPFAPPPGDIAGARRATGAPAASAGVAGPSALPLMADPVLSAPREELLFRALTLGLADYCRKTRFRSVLLGISGGIDSALVGALAARALGPDRVLGVALPGPFSTAHSISDALDLARRLGIRTLELPISAMMSTLAASIDPAFAALGEAALGATLPDVAQENVQSRLRGLALMTISNRTGSLLLTTGNKSELSVGYCTLYGDMNGGLAVISDLTKRDVYALSRWMNEHHRHAGFDRPPIPQASIDKPPSAELAPNQRDQDTLPPYDVLDEIVRRYVESHESGEQIVAATGFEGDLVCRMIRLIDLNEYKRKQLATGLKVTSVAFGVGRRMPIARGWW